MEVDTVSKKNAREKTIARLYELLELQEKVKQQFGVDGYNIFVFWQPCDNLLYGGTERYRHRCLYRRFRFI